MIRSDRKAPIHPARRPLRACLIGALLAFAGHCWAEDVIRENPSGGVNWTEGVVFARGPRWCLPRGMRARCKI